MRPMLTVCAVLGPPVYRFIKLGITPAVQVSYAVGRRPGQTKDDGPPLLALPKVKAVRTGQRARVSEKIVTLLSLVLRLRLYRTASQETKRGQACCENGGGRSRTFQRVGRVKMGEGRAQTA